MCLRIRKALLFTAVLLSSYFINQAFAADYKIDPDHSTLGFRIKHLAISSVPGRFTDFSGTFSLDEADISKSKAEVSIKAASINTEQKKRDEHLRSADFFDTTKFPDMKFVSKEVKPNGTDQFSLIGELSMHGVTKPVTLEVTKLGSAKDPWGKERSAFSAVAKLNRKDFGLAWNKLLETGGMVVGEEVQINIEIEGIKQG